MTWRYFTVAAITFVIILPSKVVTMTPDNINVSLIEQKGTPTAQTMLLNINISKEPENATQGNTEGNVLLVFSLL